MCTENDRARLKWAIGQAVRICGSQKNLGIRAGLSQSMISKYLAGDRMPKGNTAMRLAEATGNTVPMREFAPHVYR